MKKIVFFIGIRQLVNYSFDKIKDRNQFVFILMISHEDHLKLPPTLKPYFDFIVPLNSSPEFLSELSYVEAERLIYHYQSQYKTDEIAIICQDEANVLLAAKLRDHFNTHLGARYNQIAIFRNKIKMKQIMKNAQIRIPKYLALDQSISFEKIVEHIGLPFIVKPADSAGSHGVYKIKNHNEYADWLKSAEITKTLYEAEEFIDGELFHCDSAAQNGRLVFIEASQYTCPNLEFQFGKVLGSIVLPKQNPLRNELIAFATAALRALGMPDGLQHMEIFKKGNELVFLEVGARSPGLIMPRVYYKACGKNILNLDLEIEAGVQSADERTDIAPAFYAVFPLKEGIVKELVDPPIKSTYEMNWLIKIGDNTQGCKSTVDTAGVLFAYNPDYEVLKHDFFAIVARHNAVIY